MAKVSDIPRIVKRLLEREVILKEGAKAIERAIPRRTRLGKGVKENLGPTHKLPSLRESTVSIRKKLKKTGGLTGPGATPKKSGFNRTGDSLNNLKVEVSRGKIEVSLAPADQDKLIDALQIDPDYQFMRLSRAEFRRMLIAMTKRIEQALKKICFTEL
jgi:hypothetical protein